MFGASLNCETKDSDAIDQIISKNVIRRIAFIVYAMTINEPR